VEVGVKALVEAAKRIERRIVKRAIFYDDRWIGDVRDHIERGAEGRCVKSVSISIECGM